MDKDYLQALRYKLQKRVRKFSLLNNNVHQFRLQLKQFFIFLHDHKIFTGILEELERLSNLEHISKEVEFILQRRHNPNLSSEKEYAAMCYKLLSLCSELANSHDPVNIGRNLIGRQSDDSESLATFNGCILEPFYEYIDENIDETGAILSLLRKYKERCEWFKRDNLYSMWNDDTKNGEKLLAKDMYEYLHDQGLDFFIEPSSVSGEIDMISSQQGENRLLVDAKIFNPEKSKTVSYIASGFNQIYQYTLDFNQPIGYLVIFKTCEHDLKFALSDGVSSIPFTTYNNKTIFFITIDIYPYEKSASKRGSLKSYEITLADLLSPITT
jgi:hypothetical protein